MNRRHRIYLLTVLLLVPCATVGVVFAQGVTLPESIQQSLARNARALSPISVSFTEQYEAPLGQDETMAKLHVSGPPSEIFFARQSVRAIWQDGRIYSRVKPDLNGDAGDATEYSFDGSVYYLGQPDSRLPDGFPQPLLSKRPISKLAAEGPQERHLIVEYFDAMGLLLPSRSEDLLANKSCTAQVLGLLESGGRLSAVEDTESDGRAAVRIKVIAENPEWRAAQDIDLVELEKKVRGAKSVPKYAVQEAIEVTEQARQLPETRNYVFYLDPQMGYAVLRREENYEEGKPLVQVSNADFIQLEGRGVWLPRSSIVAYYTFPGSTVGTRFDAPILKRVLEVSEFGLDRVPDTQFVLDYRLPGTVVVDETAGKRTIDRMPGGKEVLDGVVNELKPVSDPGGRQVVSSSNARQDLAQAQGGTGAVVQPRRDWVPAIVVTVVALTVLGFLVAWRHRKSRGPGS